MKSVSAKITALTVAVIVFCIALGWERQTNAQNYLAQAKGGAGAKGWYGEFDALLGAHGDRNMMLEAHVVSAKQGDLIGKVVASTDAFLIMKAQDQKTVYFVTWDDVIWITARPN